MRPQPAKRSAFADNSTINLSAKADLFAGCGLVPLFAFLLKLLQEIY